MTQSEFENLCDLYGGNLSDWPHDMQHAARHTLAASVDAQRALDNAAALDAMLLEAAPEPAEVSDALMARVLGDAADISAAHATALAPQTTQPATASWREKLFSFAYWRPAGAMTACLAVGVIAGLSGAPGSFTAPTAPAESIEIADTSIEDALFDVAFSLGIDGDEGDFLGGGFL